MLSTLMPLAPMWTGLCLKEKSRDTNSKIENWMKIVKKDILQGKTRLRPGAFVRKMHGTLGGRLRVFKNIWKMRCMLIEMAYLMQKNHGEKRKANVKSHQEEKYYKRPAEIPTPKQKKVPSIQNYGKGKLNNVKWSYIFKEDNTKKERGSFNFRKVICH